MKTMNRFGVPVTALALSTVWAGCGGASSTTAAPASPPPSASASGVGVSEAQPATAASSTRTGAAAAPRPPEPAPSELPVAELAEAQRHRHHHHAGVLGLVILSLKDLDLSADQRTSIDRIRDELNQTTRPARQAGKTLADVLADGVAAGEIDEGKVHPAIDNLVAQVTAVHPASTAALNKLHDALNPKQRAELMGAVKAHWAQWKEAHGQDEAEGDEARPGHLSALAEELGLTNDQRRQIRANFRAEMKKAGQEHAHKEVEDHLRAFAAAFEADRFETNKLKNSTGSSHMARWGATRMVHFVEAALPVLTTDQRAKLAQNLRERAGRED